MSGTLTLRRERRQLVERRPFGESLIAKLDGCTRRISAVRVATAAA